MINKEFEFIPLNYFPAGQYIIGCCRYGSDVAYRTEVVKAENQLEAMKKGFAALKPSTTEHIIHLGPVNK